MNTDYSKTYEIRWSDLDANGHVNYAAYIDAAGDMRFKFFIEYGFTSEKFTELGIGPVYTAIHAEFFREVLMGETITINFYLAGLSPSGTRWKVHHEVYKSNSKKAVVLNIEGIILNLTTRQLAVPTSELLQTFNLIPRTPDFEVIPETRRTK